MTRKFYPLLLMLFLGLNLGYISFSEATEWEVATEPITDITSYTGNTPPIWGYHQSTIVRSGEKLYAVILEPWGENLQQQWSLFERSEDSWKRVYSSPRDQELNQPPMVLVDGIGRLHVFVWPEGVFNYLRFDPEGNLEEPAVEKPDTPYDDLWPYAGSGINAGNDLLGIASPYPEHRFAFRDAGSGTWSVDTAVSHAPRPESPSNFDRHAYPFVAVRDREAHIFSTQDIADPEKIAQGLGFVFSFRTLEYFYSPDLLNEPFQTIQVINVEDTKGWAHNDDLLLDSSGTIHLLYRFQNKEGDWGETPLKHAFGPPGGPLTHVTLGRSGEFNESRLWESPHGTLYVILPRFKDLYVAPLSEDGSLAEGPVSLGFSSDGWDYFGRVFLVSSRAVVSGAPFLEGLYAKALEGGGASIRYFRADPEPLEGDFDKDGKVDLSDFFMFANVFGSNDPLYDLSKNGKVDFDDFFIFASQFGLKR